MGMLRTLFVLGAGFALMPSPPPDAATTASGPSQFAYIAAAAETVADLRSFCQRNPNVCVAAGSMAQTVENKAKYSAKLIYEWANEATGDGRIKNLPDNLASADPVEISAPTVAAASMKASQNTLTLADLEPKWRKPKALPKG
jgi:Family of unknown function (DUF5330)